RSPRATLFPYTTLFRSGLSAGDLGTSWLLTRLIGPATTSEICFTGRLVDAAEALRLGIVNQVSEPGALLDESLRLAAAIVSNSRSEEHTSELQSPDHLV